MKSVLLGTLLELCDNHKTLVHVEAWRGEKALTSSCTEAKGLRFAKARTSSITKRIKNMGTFNGF